MPATTKCRASNSPTALWGRGSSVNTIPAFADPLLFNPDIGDQSQIGPMQPPNIRRPQIRYTYLAGNGVSLSASVETTPPTTYTNLVGTQPQPRPAWPPSDSTDTGGITNYPSFNAGVAWDQPWGHLMALFDLPRTKSATPRIRPFWCPARTLLTI